MKLLKWLFICLLATPCLSYAASCADSLKPESKIEPIGRYSNGPSALGRGQHSYVHAVELWHSGDCFFGFFSANGGADGEATWGLIEDFSLDKATKSAKFFSKISLGMTEENLPSKDLFEFYGKFDGKVFSGFVKYTDKLGRFPTTTQKVDLCLAKGSSGSMILKNGNTYAAWLDKEKGGIKYSSPKW